MGGCSDACGCPMAGGCSVGFARSTTSEGSRPDACSVVGRSREPRPAVGRLGRCRRAGSVSDRGASRPITDCGPVGGSVRIRAALSRARQTVGTGSAVGPAAGRDPDRRSLTAVPDRRMPDCRMPEPAGRAALTPAVGGRRPAVGSAGRGCSVGADRRQPARTGLLRRRRLATAGPERVAPSALTNRRGRRPRLLGRRPARQASRRRRHGPTSRPAGRPLGRGTRCTGRPGDDRGLIAGPGDTRRTPVPMT